MKRKSLSAAYFSLGAFALIAQTMILREFFVVVYGNEFIFGVLLTNWLVGIFIGAAAGAFVADRHKDNLLVFVLSLLVLTVVLPLAITAIRFLYSISGTPAGTYVSFSNVFIYSGLFIIPVSFFIGFAFPIAARVHTGSATAGSKDQAREQVLGISSIYIVEALGSLFGGLVFTFVLVGHFSPYFIVGLTILPLPLACWLILRKTNHTVWRSLSLILLVLILITLTPVVNMELEKSTALKRWNSFSQLPMTYSIDSKYQNITVAKHSGRYNLYLNTMFSQVFPNDDDNMLLAAHLVCQHPAPEGMRILIIGDAISGLAKHLLRFNVGKIVSVEIDREVVETIQRFLPGEDKRILKFDNRFGIEYKDGRKYVKDLRDSNSGISGEKQQEFDMVYLNVSEPSTLLLNRYYTREFFSDIAGIIKENGVVALKVTASENYRYGDISDYTASIYSTLKSVFPCIVAAPGTQNFLFASKSRDSITDKPQLLAARYAKTGVTPTKLGLVFLSLYPPAKTEATKQTLRSNSHSKINTDETPIAGFYYNKIIGWYGKSRASRVLDFFENIRLRDLVLMVVLFLLSRMLYIFIRRKPANRMRALKFHILLAVFSAGMSGLALELVILYIFQNNYGDVYHIVGFIIAIFMLGLPMGAFASNTLLAKKKLAGDSATIKAIVVILAAFAGIAFLLPRVVHIFSQTPIIEQVFIFFLTILVGFLVGLIFPLSIRIYLHEKEKTGKAAGIIDAFDHIGAAFGAFFIGSLFLPVMGVAKVCSLLMLFPLAAALLLITDALRLRAK
ncbi:MAG: hypothetical protein GY757_46760 [bacterium]|nr:hypothetical protein [bacterium]